MGKVQKTLRFEESQAERIRALQADGEAEAATIYRIMDAGLDALESGNQAEPGTPAEGEAGKEEASSPPALQAVVDAQAAHIATLENQVDVLTEQLATKDVQLATKDKQLDKWADVARGAQQLHGASDVIHAHQLDSGDNKERRGIWARLFGKYKDKEA